MRPMAKFVSPELEDFSRIVEAIYDCALDPSLWQETVRLSTTPTPYSKTITVPPGEHLFP